MHQTHPNKELLIVYEDDDPQTMAVVNEFHGRADISVQRVPASPKLTLGELRNIAIDACSGDYFCQWDDDDFHHTDRIATQLAHLQTHHQDACVLTNWLMFDTSGQRAFFSHFRLWEGSLLCRKAALGGPVRYPAISKMEDSFFMNALIAHARVVPIIAPHLYLYVLHEKNTWDRQHRQVLLSTSQPLPDDVSRLFADVLAETYTPEVASAHLASAEVARHLNYLHVNSLTPSDAQLVRYRELLERANRAATAREELPTPARAES